MKSFSDDNQQINLLILLATLLGTWLCGKWALHQITVVSTLYKLDMEISWLSYIPLILFLVAVCVVLVLVFISTLVEFELGRLLEETPWGKLLVLIFIVNLAFVAAIFAGEYITALNSNIVIGSVLLVLILLLYLFGTDRYELHPVFFLVTLTGLSALFWSFALYLIE
jgi:hypothetical protein